MGLLLLDTFVDNNVNFMALSGLRAPFSNGENEHAQADMNQSTSESLPLVPAAGSKHWLPSIVDVGRHKVVYSCAILLYSQLRIHFLHAAGPHV